MDKKILSFEEFSSRKPTEMPKNDFYLLKYYLIRHNYLEY